MENQNKDLPRSAPISLGESLQGVYSGGDTFSSRQPSVIEQISDGAAADSAEAAPAGTLEFQEPDSSISSEPQTETAVIYPQHVAGTSKAHLIISAVILAVILALVLIVAVINREQQAVERAANLVSEQAVELEAEAEAILSLDGLQSEARKLVVNGDVVAQGDMVLASGEFFGVLQAPGLSANQVYTLPDASGTICLDTNNCNYLGAGGVVTSLGGAAGVVLVGEGLVIQNNTLSATAVTPDIPTQTTIAGVSGAINLGANLNMTGNTLSATTPSGLNTTVNGLSDAIIIQGTTDQVVVNTAGQNITLSGPQNLAVTSTPTFASVALTGIGTQAGNAICDESNNCGYLSSANAYLQGGNSFGAAAILGTNDSNPLFLETNNSTRVTITADGNVGIGNTSPNYLLSVGTGDAFAVSSGGVVLLPNLATASTDMVVCRNAANQLATCNSTFAPSSGGANYIHNSTDLQTNANFTIQSAADASVAAAIRARPSQTADLLQLQNSDGTAVSGFLANGSLYFTNSGFSNSLGTATLTANQVVSLPDASGIVCLDSGNCIGAGGSAPANAQYLTLATDPSLTNARVLTAGTNMSFNDGGAGNPFTVATVANPTFSTSVTTPLLQSGGTLTITPGGDLTVGSTSQSFTLQGNDSSMITAAAGGFTTTLAFASPTADVTFNLPALSAGTYNICTTSGNCSGTGGGVTTSGGTAGRLAKFTGSQSIGDSILSEAGSVITILGDGVIQGGALSLGQASTATGALSLYNSSNGNTVTLQAGATGGDITFTLPTADGSGGQCIKTNGSGEFSFGDCLSGSGPGGGVTSLNSLAGTLNILGTADQIVVNSGGSNITLSTPQDIATTSSPTFAALTATGAGGVTIGTAGAAAGQVTLQNASNANTITLLSAVAGANRNITIPDADGTVAVSASGNIALSAAGNITFTGVLSVANGGTGAGNAGDARTNLGAAASGANGDITSTSALNTITPNGALTIGATGQNLTLQGSGVTSWSATSGGFVTTLSFAAPTANNSITIPNEAGTICLQDSEDCGFLTSGYVASNVFLQGGNSFGGTAVLGTNDNASLSFETSGATQVTIAVGGATTFKNSTNSSSAFQILQSNNSVLLQADTSGSTINLARTLVKPLANSTTAFQVQNASGSALLTVNSTASSTIINSPTNSTTAFRIQDSASTDVLIADTTNRTVSVGTPASYLSYATGGSSFSAAVFYPYTSGTGNSNHRMTAADFNNDGFKDVATANSNGDSASVFLNNGNGMFADTGATYSSSQQAYAVMAADFNGDGHPDLAVTGRSNSRVTVCFNTGTGTFISCVSYTVGGQVYGGTAADVNNDGHPDIITSNASDTNAISVLINNGNGTFATQVSYAAADSSSRSGVATADFNDDGYQDIVTVNGSSVSVSVLINNGNGTFATQVSYAVSAGSSPRDVATADLNNDTYPDIVTVNSTTNNISVLINNGSGTFAGYVDYATDVGPNQLTLADFNGDNYVDVATTYTSGVSLLTNNGTGAFPTKTTYAGISQMLSISSGDFNNDGKPDLSLGRNAGGNGVGIMINGASVQTVTAGLSVKAPTADNAGLILQSAVGQTQDILHVQDSSSSTLFNISSVGNVGIGIANAGFKVDVVGDINTNANIRTGGVTRIDLNGNLTNIHNVTAAGTSLLQGGATIESGAAANEGLIVKGAASQTANLQEWQSSTGTVLAFVDPSGNLSVANAAVTGTLTVTGAATFNATLTVNGHIITGNTSGSTTVAAEAGAGSGASASIAGNDTAGTVTVTTGTSSGAGTLATVTFANAYGANVRVVLTPANAGSSSIQYFVGTGNTTTFTIDANDAPADSTEYIYHYHVFQ